MTFEEAYAELNEEFRRRVDEDKRVWDFESIFLPNLMPEGPVDFVLVGMEPSLRGWAKNLEEAQHKINCGFRNFFGFGNFSNCPKDGGLGVLFSCISKYLCPGAETYYLTDLAQGAMKTNSPGAGKIEKYEAWYSLLEKELGLVAKPNAKIISIGKAVGDFLSRKWLHGHAGTVVHYSGQASRHWGKEIPGRCDEFHKFVSDSQKLPSGQKWSDAHTKLMFDYKIAFERIRSQDQTGWPRWQREWQCRIS